MACARRTRQVNACLHIRCRWNEDTGTSRSSAAIGKTTPVSRLPCLDPFGSFRSLPVRTALRTALEYVGHDKPAVEDVPRKVQHRLEAFHPPLREISRPHMVSAPESVELGLEDPIGMVERLCSPDRVDQRHISNCVIATVVQCSNFPRLPTPRSPRRAMGSRVGGSVRPRALAA